MTQVISGLRKVPQLYPPPSALLAWGDKLISNLPIWSNCSKKHVLRGTAVHIHTRLLQPPAGPLFILQSCWIMHVHLETTNYNNKTGKKQVNWYCTLSFTIKNKNTAALSHFEQRWQISNLQGPALEGQLLLRWMDGNACCIIDLHGLVIFYIIKTIFMIELLWKKHTYLHTHTKGK